MKKYLCLTAFLCYTCHAEVNFVIENDSDIELIQANSTEYFDDNIKLNGNVTIKYGDKTIRSDFITVSLSERNIVASGNIKIEDEQHNIITADKIHIKNGFKDGFLEKIKLTLADRSYLKAADASFIGTEYFEMDEAEYSPCYECVKDDKLTWRIKAKKVEQNAESMIYHNAVFEILDFPVLYLPYLSIPNIRIKRKSGFLYPLLTFSKTNGLMVCPRYLYSVSKSQEMIFKPIITTKTGNVFWGSYACRFFNGKFDIEGSLTGIKSLSKFDDDKNKNENDQQEKDKREEYQKIKDNSFRGHIFSNLVYEISNKTRLSAKLALVSDKYYFKKIPILYDRDARLLESNVNLENFSGDNYSSIKACYFQTLRPEERNSDIPLTLPIITHGSVYEFLGGAVNLDMMAMRLHFAGSHTTNKMFANATWKREFMLKHGHMLSFETALATSFNSIDSSQIEKIEDSSMVDVSPMFGVIWKWPLKVTYKNSDISAVFTPIIGLICSPNRRSNSLYDDSYTSGNFFELNSSNFFELIRTPLSSQLNDGSRIPHGIKGIINYRNRQLAEFMIARSFNLSDMEINVPDLKNKYSNIISEFSVYPLEHTTCFMNSSYSTKDSEFQRIETGIRYNNEMVKVSTSVFRYDDFRGKLRQKYKGIHINAEGKISKHTSLIGEVVTGMNNCTLLRRGIGVAYKNECVTVNVMYSQHFFESGDIKPDRSISFVIVFKNLGKTGFKI